MRLGLLALCALLTFPWCPPVRAEATEIRIGIQPGLTYLPFYWMERDKLVEKQAAAAGLGEVKVVYWKVAGGDVLNNAILSGDLAIAASGMPAFLPLWAKTRGSLDVRGVCAYNTIPLLLNTRNPDVRTIKDFTDKDRIALPAVKASTQAIILQMAAEQVFGPGEHGRLDQLTISRGHPDSMAALFAKGSEISAHFGAPPYQELELKNPAIHTVLKSQDVFGGAFTVGQAYSTRKFHDENPKLYAAFLAAMKEVIDRIHADDRAAAAAYLDMSKDKESVDQIAEILKEPGFSYGVTPTNTVKLAQFMYRIGSIKESPASWKDLYFPEIHDQPGS